jgi:hypothetical protein
MTVRISADIHFDAADLSHRFHPLAEGKCSAYGVLKFGIGEGNVYFDSPEKIRAAIAHLVALENEMTAALAPPAEVVEAEIVDDWCPAVTVLDDETLYCDRDPGHPGSHHAPAADGGSEVAWGDVDDDSEPPAAEPAFITEISGVPVKAAFRMVAS